MPMVICGWSGTCICLAPACEPPSQPGREGTSATARQNSDHSRTDHPPKPIYSFSPSSLFPLFSSFLLHTYLVPFSQAQDSGSSARTACIAHRGVVLAPLSFGAMGGAIFAVFSSVFIMLFRFTRSHEEDTQPTSWRSSYIVQMGTTCGGSSLIAHRVILCTHA